MELNSNFDELLEKRYTGTTFYELFFSLAKN